MMIMTMTFAIGPADNDDDRECNHCTIPLFHYSNDCWIPMRFLCHGHKKQSSSSLRWSTNCNPLLWIARRRCGGSRWRRWWRNSDTHPLPLTHHPLHHTITHQSSIICPLIYPGQHLDVLPFVSRSSRLRSFIFHPFIFSSFHHQPSRSHPSLKHHHPPYR